MNIRYRSDSGFGLEHIYYVHDDLIVAVLERGRVLNGYRDLECREERYARYQQPSAAW